jgi:hypothetical protein
MKKGKLVHWFIIGTFVSLYLAVSIISTLHVIKFFELSNPYWLSVSLAIAFELGAAASLASLIVLDKMNKFLVWSLFIVLTLFQSMGNVYYAYVNLHDFSGWVELFDLVDEDLIYQKRILSMISGGILPFVALGFIKSLVDYIRPSENKITEEEIAKEPEEEKENEAFQILDGGIVMDEEDQEEPAFTEDEQEPQTEVYVDENLVEPDLNESRVEVKEDPIVDHRSSVKDLVIKDLSSSEIEAIIGLSEIEEDEDLIEETPEYQEEVVDANKVIPIFNKDPNQSY